MPPLPTKVQGHNLRMENGVKSLAFLVWSMTLCINLTGFASGELKLTSRNQMQDRHNMNLQIYMWTWVKLNVPDDKQF